MDSMEEQGLGDHSERQENKAKRCRNGHAWAKLLLLGIIICGISLLLYETGLVHFFLSKKRILHFLEALGPWSFAGFITLQALQVIVAPIPGEVTGLLGGYLYGPLLGTLLSTFGLTLGSSVAFSLSRAFGRPFVERFVPKPAMDRFDYLLQAKGCFFVFMLFLIPLTPKDYLCYILGLGNLSALELLMVSSIGRLFGTVLLTLGGSYIRLHQYTKFSLLVAVAVGVVLLALAHKEKLERLFRTWHVNLAE